MEKTAGDLVNYQLEPRLVMEAPVTPKLSSSEQSGTRCLIVTRFLHVAVVISPTPQKQRKLVSWCLLFVTEEESSGSLGKPEPRPWR